MRILLQPAYLLHHRAYRETSLLMDVMTQDHGRIALMARGVRTQRSPLRSLLQPFTPLWVSWQGKTELMMLTGVEPRGAPLKLQGDCLLSGFYLNELLVRVLQKSDPCPAIYTAYQQALLKLQQNSLDEQVLRLFEKKLLIELGYGIELRHDYLTGQALLTEKYYQYVPERGFTLYTEQQADTPAHLFSGKSLLALAQEQLEDAECLREAKRLMRLLLGPVLGTQPIHSRKLFL